MYMQFRTPINIPPFDFRIDYSTRGLLVGSCFADSIGARMKTLKLPVAVNPFGVLFNPLSVAGCLETLEARRTYTHDELETDGERWYSFDFHSSLAGASADEALANMNAAVRTGAEALATADYLIITLGTAWVYALREGERTVANCHKVPASRFTRRRLSAGEIAERLAPLLTRLAATRHVILTVSPVRHLRDGLAENQLSKATLRVAADELARLSDRIVYFPAYEALMDDLRDYRFYAPDMVHPSAVAVDYIWELFRNAALSDEAIAATAEVAKIIAAAAHRPLNPASESHRAFRRSMYETAQALAQRHPEIDLAAELNLFGS